MSALLLVAALIVAVLASLHWPLWLAVPAVFAAYIVQSIWRPYARCWRCKGSPRYASSSGKTWRKCFVCGGKGERTRWGRKWFDSALSNRKS